MSKQSILCYLGLYSGESLAVGSYHETADSLQKYHLYAHDWQHYNNSTKFVGIRPGRKHIPSNSRLARSKVYKV